MSIDLIHFDWTPIISILNDDWFLTPLKDKVWVYKDTSTRIWSFLQHQNLSMTSHFLNIINYIYKWYKLHFRWWLPAAWPNGYGVRLRIGRLWVRVPSWSNVFEKWPMFDPWPWTYLKCYSEFLIQNIFYQHMPCRIVWRFITFWTTTVKIYEKSKIRNLQHFFLYFSCFFFSHNLGLWYFEWASNHKFVVNILYNV